MQQQQNLSRSTSSSARRNVESGKINAQLYCSGAATAALNADTDRYNETDRRTDGDSSGSSNLPSLQHFILMRHIKNYVCWRRRMTGEIKQRSPTSAVRLIIAQFIGANSRKSAASILPASPLSLSRCCLLQAPALTWRCCNTSIFPITRL